MTSPNSAAASERSTRPGLRSTTIVWGVLLIAAGGLAIALGLGYRPDAVTFAVVISSGLGVALLLLAILPRRSAHPAAAVHDPPAQAPEPAPAPPPAPAESTTATPTVINADQAETEHIWWQPRED